MPRQARLDAPGTLHHVIVRGIEKRQIVDDDKDHADFVNRLGVMGLLTKGTRFLRLEVGKSGTCGALLLALPPSPQYFATA